MKLFRGPHQGDYYKILPIYGPGSTWLQAACAARFKYRTISKILYCEWKDSGFQDNFFIELYNKSNKNPQLLIRTTIQLLVDPDCQSGEQGRVKACLLLAKSMTMALYYYERLVRQITQQHFGNYCEFCGKPLEVYAYRRMRCKKHKANIYIIPEEQEVENECFFPEWECVPPISGMQGCVW